MIMIKRRNPIIIIIRIINNNKWTTTTTATTIKTTTTKLGSIHMPSPDTNFNTFNNNIIDMVMDKIKIYSSSFAPPGVHR